MEECRKVIHQLIKWKMARWKAARREAHHGTVAPRCFVVHGLLVIGVSTGPFVRLPRHSGLKHGWLSRLRSYFILDPLICALTRW